jgi:WD40 repeat protein
MNHDVASYLLNLKNNDRYEIPSSTGGVTLWYYSASVSPNGSWLAYIETFEGSSRLRLNLLSADHQEQPFIDLQDGWGWIINWLDDQRLLLSPSVSSYDQGITPNGEMAILNPFSQDWVVLSPDLPVQISIDPMPWSPGRVIPIVIYDPSLTRAVYLSLQGFYLIDSQSQSIIKELQTHNYGTRPRWSPQGDSFAFVIDDAEHPMFRSEIYQISREGQTKQITHLYDAFGSNVSVQNFNWSPDGEKIAFAYYVHDSSTDEQVAVVDIETGQIVTYCLPIVGGLPPIWSPDGHQIAFVSATIEESNNNIFRTIIVDIEQGFAIQVAENMLPLGWMVSP